MSEVKDTNPKDAIGIKKAPLSTVSGPFMMATGLAMMEGARKYGRHNYRAAGVRASVYFDAIMRHMMAWWEGEDLDPDSGIPHPIKAAACLAVLYDCMVFGNLNDDRPPKQTPEWIKEFNKMAEVIIEKYPDCKPPYVHGEQR